MASYTINTKDITAQLNTDRFNKQFKKAYNDLNEAIIQDTEQFVPMDTGELRRSATIHNSGDLSGDIEYTAPYADYVYENEAFDYTTPGTGSHWFDKAKATYGQKWINEAKKTAGGGTN